MMVKGGRNPHSVSCPTDAFFAGGAIGAAISGTERAVFQHAKRIGYLRIKIGRLEPGVGGAAENGKIPLKG